MKLISLSFCCRSEDAAKAFEGSQEKKFFGGKVTVSVHDGLGLYAFCIKSYTHYLPSQRFKVVGSRSEILGRRFQVRDSVSEILDQRFKVRGSRSELL